MSGRGGHIVMTGSMSAEVAEKRSAVYVATKAGVRDVPPVCARRPIPFGDPDKFD